jgi:sugar-specific transcriptional regulator TrmB
LNGDEIFQLAGAKEARYILDRFAGASKIDCYLGRLDSRDLAGFVMGLEKKRGRQLRVIASITGENMDAAKQLMRRSDLHHADSVEASFCIVDASEYLCYVEGAKNKALYSAHPPFVRVQQFLFDNLLGKAVLAKDRVKEIERGTQSEYINTVRDPSEILGLAAKMVRSAGFEILVLFSTINSFYRAEGDGLLDLLGKASDSGVSVRVLIKVDDDAMKDASKQKIKQKHDSINVSFIRQLLRSKITTFVVDQSFSLAVEVNDDAKKDFAEATGLATHSNSDSTVFTYYSMFENLWTQAELERQSSARQAYFHMFKGQKMRDETYRRDWKVKEGEQ